jgi:mannan endo-1,4-beta-mannosidase
MKKYILRSLLALFGAWGSPAIGQPTLLSPPPVPCEPVNPNATAEARALLKTICAVSGKYILSGQHNFPYHLSRHSDKLAASVAKYPMIWGSDFGFTGGTDQDSIEGRDAMIEEAKRQYAAGSIITLMWHAVRPTEDEPVLPGAGWRGSVQAKLTNDQWAALTTPGTDLNRRWLAQLDKVAGYLKRLQEAKIPVLWRPYHENNGSWFWWGGRKGPDGFQALYRMTFDRLVNYHRLDNLIWVWNTNSPNGKNAGPYYEYYPGPEYVDILATDIYGEFLQSHYDDLVKLAAGKPVALGEIGKPPSLEVLQHQPKWAWFMGWADIFDLAPTDAHKALFADPQTLSRGDKLPDAQPATLTASPSTGPATAP